MISMTLSWIAFVQVGFGHHDERVSVFTWILLGDLKVDWSLRIDTLTAIMLAMVTFISTLVAVYSIGYMHDDPTGRGSSPIFAVRVLDDDARRGTILC